MVNYYLREMMDTLGDVGTNKSELEKAFKEDNFDFTQIPHEIWWACEDDINLQKCNNIDKNGFVIKETEEQVQDRIQLFKTWLLNRPEKKYCYCWTWSMVKTICWV